MPGLGIEHLQAAIGRARLVIAQVNPELPWTPTATRRSSRRRSMCWRASLAMQGAWG